MLFLLIFIFRYEANKQTQSTIVWHNQKTGNYELISFQYYYFKLINSNIFYYYWHYYCYFFDLINITFPRNADKSRFLTSVLLQCIKKEFVGIFEMCGYAILPGRLGRQIPIMANLLSSVDHNKPYQIPSSYNHHEMHILYTLLL